jgi:hypothetical protein
MENGRRTERDFNTLRGPQAPDLSGRDDKFVVVLAATPVTNLSSRPERSGVERSAVLRG